MPETALSPQVGAEGVVQISIFSGGTLVPDNVQLLSVSISRAINKIPRARLALLDGDMPSQSFPLSDADHFKPGAVIKISAGYGGNQEPLFEGIVIKHSISIAGDNKSQLLVECCDQAARMTVGRNSASYKDQSDADIIKALISANGLQADVPSTSITHKMLVQHYCSDWDFILARANANGLLVVVTDGKISVKPPQADSAPTLKCSYGLDLMSFHGELDARTQWASAQAFAWDMANQKVVEADAPAAVLNAQGNIKSSELAKVLDMRANRLQSAAPIPEPELTVWAKAAQLKAGLARVRGRMTFQGSAKAIVGGLIEVDGVGERFNGKVFVSAVNHKIAEGNWTTDVEFGMWPEWHAERSDVVAPPASGLLPGVNGLQIGVVSQLHDDPEGQNRVQVTLPLHGVGAGGVWARLAMPYASQEAGIFLMPEIGDEVVLGYFGNDPSYPVIIGSLYSSARPTPYSLQNDNNIKAIVTRSKSKIEFNDQDKIITVTTPGNNQIILNDKDQSIQLIDQNDNKVELTPSGISLDSRKDIRINAKGSIAIDAAGKIDITSKADVLSSGLNVKCDAQVAFVGRGNAKAELLSSGTTTVKGAMVIIN
jgi:Rhs element Vgr protein